MAIFLLLHHAQEVIEALKDHLVLALEEELVAEVVMKSMTRISQLSLNITIQVPKVAHTARLR